MSVYINTKMMKDREYAEEMNSQAELLIRKGTEQADRIYGIVSVSYTHLPSTGKAVPENRSGSYISVSYTHLDVYKRQPGRSFRMPYPCYTSS